MCSSGGSEHCSESRIELTDQAEQCDCASVDVYCPVAAEAVFRCTTRRRGIGQAAAEAALRCDRLPGHGRDVVLELRDQRGQERGGQGVAAGGWSLTAWSQGLGKTLYRISSILIYLCTCMQTVTICLGRV
jgi:hypothetical protein